MRARHGANIVCILLLLWLLGSLVVAGIVALAKGGLSDTEGTIVFVVGFGPIVVAMFLGIVVALVVGLFDEIAKFKRAKR